jgi:sec-independent protein translocase protein TatA
MTNGIYLFIFGPIGTTELIVIVLIIVLLFGATRLPQLAKALGQSKRAFKEGITEGESNDDDKKLNEGKNKSLSGISDEELFEEAHRRSQEMKK